MPSSSKKQHRFMEAIAHNPGFAKKVGIPQSVGKDFSNADKGKSFSKGGGMQKRKYADGGMFRAGMEVPQDKDGASVTPKPMIKKPPMAFKKPMPKKPMLPPGGGMPPPGGGMPPPGLKHGGMPKKMATGGFVRAADGVASKGKTKAKQIRMAGGGKC